MKKLISSLIALATCLSFNVNVQAKQTKVDRMMDLIKQKRYKEAWKLNNTLPTECKTYGKLSAKNKRLYLYKLGKMKKNWYWFYDINGDKKADLFVNDLYYKIHVYTVRGNKVVSLGKSYMNPHWSFIANPGTNHFYACDISQSLTTEYIYKYTYKKGKFKVTEMPSFPMDKFGRTWFNYNFKSYGGDM